MNQDSSVKVRVATSDDVDTIVQISEGIYNGGDYLPVVLHQWLTEERRFIFLAEYQGEVIGLHVATITTDQKSFVTQSLRIHPKYRGKKLSYQLTDAVTTEMCTRFPQISKNILTCIKPSAAFKMYTNKGYKTLEELTYHLVHIKPSDIVCVRRESQNWNDTGLVSMCEKDTLKVLKDKKILDLVGSHGIVFGNHYFPRKLPEEAQLEAEEIAKTGVMFVEASQPEDNGFPSSLSYGFASRRVKSYHWLSYIYANDADIFKKHFLNHLKSALAHYSEDHHLEMHCYPVQSRGISFDGCNVIMNELSRLQGDLKVTSECDVLLEDDL